MSQQQTPSNFDFPTFLYLNPELPAYSNLTTVEAVKDSYGPWSLCNLPHALPPTPAGFDARVFLAAQPDISGLNATIMDAMVAEGMDARAVARRGVFVGTLMQPAQIRTPNTIECPSASFSDCNLRVGDTVRVLRPRGDAVQGTVTSVVSPTTFTLSNPTHAFADPTCTVFGIRIADPHRQASVALARAATMTDPNDNGPLRGFDARMYRELYPDTRGFSDPDAYIDYRTRWKRQEEYRVIVGRDIFNLSAPYSSNLLSAAKTAGADFTVVGDLIAAGSNVFVSPSNVVVHTDLTVGDGFFSATPTNVNIGGGNLTVSPTSVSTCSNLVVEDNNASMHSGFTVAGSNVVITDRVVRISTSNLVVTSEGVDMAGSNLVVSWDGISAAYGNLVITSDMASLRNDMVIGGGLGLGMPNPVMNLDGSGTRVAVSGDIFSTGTVITQSDVRAKTDIRPIMGALDRVRQLRGYTFATATGGDRRHVGLIAQEVQRVLPEAVYGGGPDGEGMISIAYGNLVGLLVEAVNELAAAVSDV